MSRTDRGATDSEDSDIGRRVRGGEEAAYGALIRKYQRQLYSLCYRVTGHDAAAEDAAQEAFVRVFFALRRFDQARPFLPWLIRIAVNRAITVAARERIYAPLPESISLRARATGPDGEAAAQEAQVTSAVRDAVSALSPKLRAVVALRVFEEMSYEEIARALRLSIGTVMSRLSRGREQLKAKLDRFL